MARSQIHRGGDWLENEVEVRLEVLEFVFIAGTKDGVRAPRVPYLACIGAEANVAEFLDQ